MSSRLRFLATSVVIGGLGLAACSGGTPAALNKAAPASRHGSSSERGIAGLGRRAAGRTSIGRMSASAPKAGSAAPLLSPLIVRTGQLTLRVGRGRVVSTFNRATMIVASYGGFVQSSATGLTPPFTVPQRHRRHQEKGASAILRVPTKNFGALVSSISGLGKVERESVHGTDVTSQSINLRARIANLQSEEAALRALISRAGTIPNILRVENELFNVEQQIEMLSAESNSLLARVTYATLTVFIWPRVATTSPPPSKPRTNAIVHAATLAGQHSLDVVRDLVLGIGWGFPIIILAGLGWLGLVGRRRLRRRRTAELPA